MLLMIVDCRCWILMLIVILLLLYIAASCDFINIHHTLKLKWFFPTKCIHKHLEDEFNECGDDGRTVVISDPCSKCWYCSRAYTNIKHPIRSIDKDGTINVLESIFLRQNGSPIHATKLPKMINDHQWLVELALK